MGTLLYKESQIVEGYHENDELIFGRIIYIDGSVYEGATKEGKKEGKGRYTYPLGDSYDGYWKNDKK